MRDVRGQIAAESFEAFRRDGVVVLKQLINAHELELVGEGIDRAIASPSDLAREYGGKGDGAGFFYDACRIPDIPELKSFVFDSPMASVAAHLMGSETATAFYFTIFARSPGCSVRTPWHRDQTGWCATGADGLSIWLSLERVPRKSALEFVPGSHLWNVNFKRTGFDAENLGTAREVAGLEDAEPMPDLFGADRDKYKIVGWDMEPGDCLVFHAKTLHGGAGNLPAGLGRRTLSTQWIGDDSRVVQPPGGADPDWTDDLARHGIGLGEHPACDMCPRLWPPDDSSYRA